MASPPSTSPGAGGILMALGAVGGSIIGLYSGQPSIGFLIGLGSGTMIAIVMWLRTR